MCAGAAVRGLCFLLLIACWILLLAAMMGPRAEYSCPDVPGEFHCELGEKTKKNIVSNSWKVILKTGSVASGCSKNFKGCAKTHFHVLEREEKVAKGLYAVSELIVTVALVLAFISCCGCLPCCSIFSTLTCICLSACALTITGVVHHAKFDPGKFLLDTVIDPTMPDLTTTSLPPSTTISMSGKVSPANITLTPIAAKLSFMGTPWDESGTHVAIRKIQNHPEYGHLKHRMGFSIWCGVFAALGLGAVALLSLMWYVCQNGCNSKQRSGGLHFGNPESRAI